MASENWKAPAGIEVTAFCRPPIPRGSRRCSSDSGARDVLFVGSTRGEFRPAVRGALRSDRADDLLLYGVGWAEFVEQSRITGEFLANEDLPAAYSAAEIVLNDHHREMAEAGFLSNRLFDAVASGARVLTDRAVGLEETFGASVVVFRQRRSSRGFARAARSMWCSVMNRSRRSAAARIAEQHSFDQRAGVLIERARKSGIPDE